MTPQFFATIGVPVLEGRGFTDRDRADAPLVAIASRAGAKRIWGDGSAVGRHFRRSGAVGPNFEIVGVAPDIRFRDLTADLTASSAGPDVYFSYAQRLDPDLELTVRSDDGAPVPLASLQAAVSGLDAGLPVYGVQRLEDAVARRTSTARFGSALLTVFSGGALLLAAIGLYGLIAYVVGLSQREIAIRLALGADSRGVAALIVRNAMTLVVGGVLIGVGGALAAGRVLESREFQTRTADPMMYAVVAGLLLTVTFVASLLPTRRAVRVMPQAALRGD